MLQAVEETHRRRNIHRVTSVFAGVLLAAATVWFGVQVAAYSSHRSQDTYADLTCAEVQNVLKQYGHGVLAAKLEERIGAHLRRCRHCEAMRQKLQQPPSHHSWRTLPSPEVAMAP